MQFFWEYLRTPAAHALVLAIAGAGAALGLLVTWAACSSVHWFWRALVVWGGVMLLVPVRAYEIAVLFAIASPMCIGILLVGRRIHGQAALRFGLRDLFLLMVLAGLVIVGLQTIPLGMFRYLDWIVLLTWAGFVAAIVSLSYACAVSGRPVLPFLLLLVAVVGTALTLSAFYGSRQWAFGQTYMAMWALRDPATLIAKRSYAADATLMGLVHAELALLVALFVGLARARGGRVWLGALSMCGGLGLIWLYTQMLWLTAIPRFAAGGPNHYDRIVAIARQLEKPAANETIDKDQIIAQLPILLREANFVVVDRPKNFGAKEITDHQANIWSIAQLARSIQADAAAADAQGEFERAAESLALNIRLATMLSRGGFEIDTAMFCQSEFLEHLTRIRADLSPQAVRNVLTALRRASSEREPRQIVLQRMQGVMERADGWKRRFIIIFRTLASLDPIEIDTYGIETRQQMAVYEHLIQGELAIRLYRHERGRYPDSLADLTPEYLDAVPVDPFATPPQSLRYRVENAGFVLYSVGKDGIDDGGQFGPFRTYGKAGYDCNVETWLRP